MRVLRIPIDALKNGKNGFAGRSLDRLVAWYRLNQKDKNEVAFLIFIGRKSQFRSQSDFSRCQSFCL